MENNKIETFNYTYSAEQQAELKKIRAKYIPAEESKLDQLRRLDRSAGQKGTAMALVVGVLGTIVMGGGMSMIMVWGGSLFVPGIIVGIAGIAGVCAAYPLYLHTTKKEREKIAPEIIRLTDELMK